MVLRAETPQERELFNLFNRLTPVQRERFLAGLREFVDGQIDTWPGPSPRGQARAEEPPTASARPSAHPKVDIQDSETTVPARGRGS